MNRDVSAIFNQFANREIAITEKDEKVTIGNDTYDMTHVDFTNENDPLLAEIESVATQNGLQVRYILPGQMQTMDFRMNRVNIGITKGADDKWRISSSFSLG